ncbi:MAG TPA: hypothetical protein VKZ53_15875 [Candidatus Angelobacter sp.]|nr:hypothetical protein [Candidatus Angelobacter sp.]
MSHEGLGWVALFFLGAYHGINPGMGWLFAVALGMQRQDDRVVWQSLLPIACGHVIAICLVIVSAELVGAVLPEKTVRIAVAILLLAFGGYRLLRTGHPRWGSMQAGFRDLVIWSFLIASAHGAGFMLLPVLLGIEHTESSSHAMHGHAAMSASFWQSLMAVLVHTIGYLMAMGIVAFIVYRKVGLGLLRRAWINLDLIWAVVLILTAVLILIFPF